MQQNTQTPAQTNFQPITNGKSRRGFASMDKDRHKLVSSKGGKTERTRQSVNLERSVRTSYEGF